jgi:hypothetical protein
VARAAEAWAETARAEAEAWAEMARAEAEARTHLKLFLIIMVSLLIAWYLSLKN